MDQHSWARQALCISSTSPPVLAAPVTRTIFHPDDDALLTYLNDDGLSIEPEVRQSGAGPVDADGLLTLRLLTLAPLAPRLQFYVPLIPLVLVNGADGIGTGYSTSIPCYNPRDVCAAVRARITGAACAPLKPWYRGFTGTIEAKGDASASRFIISGIASVDAAGETLTISELPVRRWTQDCKALLVSYVTGEAVSSKTDDAKGAGKGAKGGAAAAKKAAGSKAAAVAKAPKAGAGAGSAAAAAVAPAKRPTKAIRKPAPGDDDSDGGASDDDDDDDFDEAAAASDDEDEEETEAKPKKARVAAADTFVVPPGEPLLTGFAENHTDTTVSFTVTPTPLLAPLFEKNAGKSGSELSPALRKLFKLETTISTSNMMLFDAEGHSA